MSRINPYKLFVGSFLPNWLLRLPDLQASSKLVYGRLCQYAGVKGVAFPSLNEMASELGLGVRTVGRAIDELEKAGLIEAEQQGWQRTNRYFFLAHPAMKTRDEVTGQNGVSVSGQSGHSGVVKMATPIERDSGKENHTPQPPKGESVRFDEFWEAYPRKEAKPKCAAIWNRRSLRLNEKADEILAGLRRWMKSDQWQNPRFIPHPSTFLNQERWRDTPPADEAKPLAKGEVRVRDTTAAEQQEASSRSEFLTLMKANPGKSESEIARMLNQNGGTQ